MMRHLLPTFIILLLLVWATNVFASTCPTTNVVSDPELFQWTYNAEGDYYSGTLVMDEATFDIGGETLTTRAYGQEGHGVSIPGPTIVMAPGKKYVMQFKNLLPYHEDPVMEHNVFKDPNITNVHTHGLHISGESPGDDVTRWFKGGTGGDYVYDIPANHMGGTFWYHAHHHGSTYLQVSSGAFGMIVIDDSNDGLPLNVAAMQERLITLGFLEPGNSAGTGGDTLISGTFSQGWTANGTSNGNICMPPNTWQHWRTLVADQDSRLTDLEIGDGCEVKLMARDGVWRTQVPGDVPSNTLTLTGASRADLAVRCTADSTISVGGTQVANIYVEGTADATVSPYATANGTSTWSAVRPAYLRDLRGETVSNTETIRMGARSVLGSKFDPDNANLTLPANGVQEWSLNGATNHPFHLHIYHVQVQNDCGPYEAGEYYDVIAGNCDLRFDMSYSEAYEGRTIFHCHILEHEDQGAMGWMHVIGGRLPPVYPDAQYSAFYSLGGGGTEPGAPSNLTATAVSSSEIDLVWADNSNDETRFEIERSTDGTNFSLLTAVAEDTTSYTDSGLNANSIYYYQVAAVNGSGSSAFSNIASDTTQGQSGTGTLVLVGSITVSTQNAGKGQKFGRADIHVVDDLGNPVNGALVSGDFSGDITESVIEAQTDANGDVTVITSGSTKPLNSLTFCVSTITHGALQDFLGPPVCSSL